LPVRTTKRRIPTRSTATEEIKQEIKGELLSDDDFRTVSEISRAAAAKGKSETAAANGKNDVAG